MSSQSSITAAGGYPVRPALGSAEGRTCLRSTSSVCVRLRQSVCTPIRLQPKRAAKATTWRSSDGSTPHVSHKQARDQQVTCSFHSQPTCMEGEAQSGDSVDHCPASPQGPASRPLRSAVLRLPWFKNRAKTGAIILGSVPVTLAREPCEPKEDLAAVKKKDWLTVP